MVLLFVAAGIVLAAVMALRSWWVLGWRRARRTRRRQRPGHRLHVQARQPVLRRAGSGHRGADRGRARGGLAAAQAAVLRRLVGDLEEVGDRQRGERGRHEPGEPGREHQADVERGHHPEAEAVRTRHELSDGLPGAPAPRPLLELARAAPALVFGEGGAEEARDLVLRDEAAQLVARRADQEEVTHPDGPGKAAPGALRREKRSPY